MCRSKPRLTSADEFKDKKELSDFTPEEKKEALMKEYNNLVSTGTIELVPSDLLRRIDSISSGENISDC